MRRRPTSATRELSYAEAIREGLAQAMEADPRVFLFGEDVGVYGGAFGVSGDLVHRFGTERVIDTPISELGLAGAAVGAALTGMRPVLEIQFSDFVTLAMEQIVNQAAKIRFMFGGKASVPMVVRLPGGSGTGAAAQHSQSLEAWFAHVPGLKVVQPSTPHDAKGLLLAAIDDPNPVLIFEHKLLYKTKGPVPAAPYRVPIGEALVRRAGTRRHDRRLLRSWRSARWRRRSALRRKASTPKSSTCARCARSTSRRSRRACARRIGSSSSTKASRRWASARRSPHWSPRARFSTRSTAPIVRLGGADSPIPYNPVLEKAAVPQEDDIVAAARQLVGRRTALMPAIEVILPKVDMDMESGVIVGVEGAEGAIVNEGDIIFEMETNKAMMEVEAPGTGVIRDLARVTGEPIPVGTTVAWIDPVSA